MEPVRSGRYTPAEFVHYLDMCYRAQSRRPLKHDFDEMARKVERHGDLVYLEYEIDASNAAELSFVSKYLIDTVGGPNAIVMLVSVIKNDVHAHVEVGDGVREVYRPMEILAALRQAGEDLLSRNRGVDSERLKRLLVDSHFETARLKVLGHFDSWH
jgi:hypothetical protein